MEFDSEGGLAISHLSSLLRRRRLSAVELVAQCLDRAEKLQPRVNAFITITRHVALRQARKADLEIRRGEYRGLLHGIPMSLKDLFLTKGIRTTAGSLIFGRFIPSVNAAVVDRLSAAGAVLLGKTGLHEFAFGATNVNPHFGPVRNPWDPDRMSGGSSGGSAAAVVCGLGVYSIGTDTGGSVRIPAAACGCVGIKPTYGLVPTSGVIPLSTTLDHVGPICRSVRDAAIVLDCLAGKSGRSGFARSLSPVLRGMRIGIPKDYFFDRLEKAVRARVVEAALEMERAGARLRDVSVIGMSETAELASDITVAEALAYHRDWLGGKPELYGEDLRTRMQQACGMTAVHYITALQRRREYSARLESALEEVDILLAPTTPVVAPRLATTEVSFGRVREDVRVALLRLTRPANLSGLPAITVPCGFSQDVLPVGLQLIGRRWGEQTVLNAALAYETRTPWHGQIPAITMN
jgi:aspartyl-tRNA(Asn)/glutamyl-tRNA(Gln) amidotransferase subunit A